MALQLDVREVARLFDVAEKTVYRWIQEDDLPASTVEGHHRFHRGEVLEWASARNLAPSPDIFAADGVAPALSVARALERGGISTIDLAGRDAVLDTLVSRLPIADTDRATVCEVVRARRHGFSLVAGVALPQVRHPLVLDVPHASLTIARLARPLVLEPGLPEVGVAMLLVTPSARWHLAMLSRLTLVVHDPTVRALLFGDAAAPAIATAMDEAEAHHRANHALDPHALAPGGAPR